MPSGRLVGIGVFVIGGVLLFAVGLFMIGNRRMLFAQSFDVHAEFARLSGVEIGANVRVAGMDAGEVTAIQIPPGPAAKFRVQMRVREDLHQLVRLDSIASIQNDGLVGNKFVQIDEGTERAAPVASGGTIAGREPFDVQQLLQQLSDTVETVNSTIVTLGGEIESALGQLADTVGHADALVQGVSADVKAMTESGRLVAEQANAIMTSIRSGEGTIGKLVNDRELYDRTLVMAQRAEETMNNVRDVTVETRKMVTDFRAQGGAVSGLTTELRRTLGFAREAMADMAENTEALKRNWFFRGFFNRRGYFDLNALTPAEYAAGALEGKTRRGLRIWLTGSLLFVDGPEGDLTLSAGGRARLDSAMAEFLRYPRDSPLMVEGHVADGTRDARFLLARLRTELVRDYLISRFELAPNRVGEIFLDEPVTASPNGGSWDGVALTLFVERELVTRQQPAELVRAN